SRRRGYWLRHAAAAFGVAGGVGGGRSPALKLKPFAPILPFAVESDSRGAMADAGTSAGMAAPIEANRPVISVDRTERIGGIGRMVILACFLVGAAITFAVIGRDAAQPFGLGLLGILAMV